MIPIREGCWQKGSKPGMPRQIGKKGNMAHEGIEAEGVGAGQSPLPGRAVEEIADLIFHLPGMASLPKDKVKDPDFLTAKLFHAFSRPHSREILTYFTLLNLGRLEELARKKCTESFYLLHPGRIAERVLAKSFQRRDELPASNRYLDWADQIMESVMGDAVRDGELGLFSDGWEGCNDPPLRRRLQAIAQVNNQLPKDLRQISYLVFFEGLSAREIAKKLNYPLEQVEFILEQVFETVRKRLDGTGGFSHE